MSERVSAVSHDQNPSCLKTLVTEPLNIFLRNKILFFSIFFLLSLPLSLLFFSLSLSSYPLKSQILRLESLATLAHTRFEARHVWQESRSDALSLFRLKLLYFVPSSFLSLLAGITTVAAAESTYHKRPVFLKDAVVAVKSVWTRPLVTSICIYVVLFLYAAVPRTLATVVGGTNPGLRFVIWIIGLVVEVYIMAVMGMGLVVSITERRFGWSAIRVGSNLMEGRRTCGWVMSGFLAALTGWIGSKLEEGATDSKAFPGKSKWAVATVVERWERAGLVGLYAAVVVWGYVVATVFYCECRKRHGVKEEDEGGIEF